MNKEILKFIVCFVAISLLCSCNKLETDEANLKQQDELKLTQMFEEIQNLSTSKPCVNASEWKFVGFGSKACGGFVGYIAYSTQIDTTLFLQKIENHKLAQKNYNFKWKIFSDCSISRIPKNIVCQDNKPIFQYE